ncbi:MAG: hypothetical protein HC880_17945 [Bacteroidia bacterium]|nr:hypothetical protein [Bacteroidia bacterium]
MRNSLNEIREAEQFMLGKMSPGDQLLYQARTLTHPGLRQRLRLLKRVYRWSGLYHRQQLKQDICQLEQRMFSHPDYQSFQNQIQTIFK